MPPFEEVRTQENSRRRDNGAEKDSAPAQARNRAGKAAAVGRPFKPFGRGASWTWRLVRRARDADGAGESGLARMHELHAASLAGDALVAVALAGTVFFSVPLGEARTKVALYLGVTMLPFILLAPLVGPILDRFGHGRRWALATTMLTRAFLAWILADHGDQWVLYPAAFGVLVMSRAYGVGRAAGMPRVLPAGLELVNANARSSLFGTIAATLVVPIGIGLATIGPEWTLRAAAVVFLVGMVFALRLPASADSGPPEQLPRIFHLPGHGAKGILAGKPVVAALVNTGSLRALYGFLTLFLAFRVREDDFDVPAALALGAVVAAAAIGTFASSGVGSKLRPTAPLKVQTGGMVATTLIAAVAAVFYGWITVAVLAAAVAFAGGLAKLANDAMIQTELPERVRSSAFAHSETLLQLAWVAGGGIGLIPMAGQLGLAVAAVLMLAATVRALIWWISLRGTPARLAEAEGHH